MHLVMVDQMTWTCFPFPLPPLICCFPPGTQGPTCSSRAAARRVSSTSSRDSASACARRGSSASSSAFTLHGGWLGGWWG